jgi:hypothetical protein
MSQLWGRAFSLSLLFGNKVGAPKTPARRCAPNLAREHHGIVSVAAVFDRRPCGEPVGRSQTRGVPRQARFEARMHFMVYRSPQIRQGPSSPAYGRLVFDSVERVVPAEFTEWPR